MTDASNQGKAPAVAFRGTTALDESQLKAHLSDLLELPHVGVLLGAGASVVAGGKIIAGLSKDFERRLGADTACAASVKPVLKGRDGTIDLEASWSRLLQLRDLTWLPLGNRDLAAHGETARRMLFDLLLDAAVLDSSKGVAAHEALLLKLLATRDPGQPPRWIFTTNYDLAIERAAESLGVHLVSGFVGVHQRRFDPTALDLGYYLRAARGEARFGAPYACLAKLHGSLSWFEQDDHVIEVSEAEAQRRRQEREPVLIPPSHAKYMDTVGFVQGELFRRLAEFVQQPDSVLLVNGYALSDRHLDRLLLTGLLNPTFHLVLCCYGAEVIDDSGQPALKPKDGATLSSRALECLSKRHPAITFVGGGAGEPADFARFVRLLPEPAVLDERARRMREIARQLVAFAAEKAPPGGSPS